MAQRVKTVYRYPSRGYSYQDNVWDSGMEFVSSCGKCGNQDYTVGIRPTAQMKINALMREYTNIEWLAYLSGYIDHERGYAEVTDLIIPENQSITYGSVDDVERDFDAVGVIHSHHKMNMSFSATDWKYVNSNNDISIVVYNNGNNMDCSMRVRTECGAMSFIRPQINIVFNEEFDENAFIQHARTRIHEGIGEFGYRYGYGYRRGYNYNARTTKPSNGQNTNSTPPVTINDSDEEDFIFSEDEDILSRLEREIAEGNAPALDDDKPLNDEAWGAQEYFNRNKEGEKEYQDPFYYEE